MSPIAETLLTFSGVAAVGLWLGSLKYRGIGLGSAGVLFAALAAGHFGAHIDHEIAEFAKEFGLVLFVFAIGLQMGPGIVQVWRQRGLTLNSLAVLIVTGGYGIVLAAGWAGWLSPLATAGLFSGATTNTPSLGASQQAAAALVAGRADQDAAAPAALIDSVDVLASAYAVAYPGGILGIIAAMLILRRWLFAETSQDGSTDSAGVPVDASQAIERRVVMVSNERIAGVRFGDLPGVEETGVRVSRIRRVDQTEVQVANDQVPLHNGDLLLIVGTRYQLDRFEPLIGVPSDVDLMAGGGRVQSRRVVVTEPDVLNQPLRKLSLDVRHNCTITRINRAGLEMTARGTTRLQYGDVVHVVGEADALDLVSAELGNHLKSLQETQFIPVFIGIAVGVLVGTLPLPLPGVPFPVKLGLAGGPLLAAIVFSLIGSWGKFVWYIPYPANLALRELGLILFLASAGLMAGGRFLEVALTPRGGVWMAMGLVVTMLPLLVVGVLAKKVCRLDFATLCGVLAGSMTDPPALAFAGAIVRSEASVTAYAAVYPLTMVLRIVAAQSIVFLLWS